MKILVTGGNGQLGSELKVLSDVYPEFNFDFTDTHSLDITSDKKVLNYFENNSFDYCINCAAYTLVDKAETDAILADKVNNLGSSNISLACKKYDTILIHISTDFVFDGKSNVAYTENDAHAPINVYGETKLKGEFAVQKILQKYFIIRTSWLYSSFGNNFVKTMLKLAITKNTLNVIDDQVGTPTFARDLARVVLNIIENNNTSYGLYHYSNEGVSSWFDFAQAIFEYSYLNTEVIPIVTEHYPTPAKRPRFTVLNKTKIKENCKIKIPYWRDSLKECLKLI